MKRKGGGILVNGLRPITGTAAVDSAGSACPKPSGWPAPLGAEAVLILMQEELKLFTGDVPQIDDITRVAIGKR